MFGLGMPELIVIFCIILIFFGGNRVVDIARGLGKSIKEFKKAISESQGENSNQTKA